MIPDLGKAIDAMLWLLLFSIPLAIWKLVDIAIWIIRHINVSFN